MSNVISHARQWTLAAVQEFDFEDCDVAPSLVTIDLPVNAVVTGGGVLVTTVFSAASSTLDLGPAANTDLYSATPVALTALGFTALDNAALATVKTSGETILLTPDANAISSTSGAGLIIVEYYILDRANEVQP